MASIFDVGSSALTSIQRAMATTGNNIANVNTDGYSRQDVLLATRSPESSGGVQFGTGVSINDVRRAYDRFLTAEVVSRQGSNGFYSSYTASAERTDALLSDPGTSLSGALDTFFAAMEAVSASPTSASERQVVIAEANTLVDRFHYLDNRLRDQAEELNARVETLQVDINLYAREIAQLNQSISRAQTGVNGTPNDLLDQRDRAISGLSALIKVETVTQKDGSVDIVIGRGQRLVTGNEAETLSVSAENRSDGPIRVFLSAPSGGESDITALMVGGQFGGAIEASKDLVDRSRRELGLLAIGIAKTFNEQHQNGLDLNGQTGGDFFEVGDPLVTGRLNNSGGSVVTATVSDVAALTGDSVTLSYTAEGVRLTNNTSGQTQLLQGSPVDIDGVTLEFSDANPNLVGDEFLIEPTAGAAASFSVVITDGAEIAAAGAGGGVGDNRNVRALIGLGDSSPLLNGTRGYRGMYNTTVSNIAVETRSAQANAKTEDALLQSALDRRDSVVGVNLEEEAANLIRYQQAYQAAAQVISTANDSFDTLIRATSR